MDFFFARTLLFCLGLFVVNKISATTIIPFHNLGEMSDASTLVVLATAGETFEVETQSQTYWHTPINIDFVSKGNVKVNSVLELESYSTKGDDWVSIVPDDVQLKEGKTYLLFLTETNTGFWRPILMSYGVFEQFQPNEGDAYLIPTPEWANLNIINPTDGQAVEPLGVYRASQLLAHLLEVAQMGTTWNGWKALETNDVSSFSQAIEERAAPAHCTFLNSGGIGFRWLNFPGSPVNIRYPEAGDSDCSPPTNANTYASTAAATMASVYDGTNLVDGGTFSGFVPNCADNTAVGDDFITWVFNNLGGYRNIVIQYNDPCNQITNMNNCAGTLAIGGLYGYSPIYQYDGNPYYEGRYGYVILNNAVCTCLSATNYGLVLTHEMTHSLGIGHIAGTNTANMNPSCCHNIANLDEQCVDYLYSPPLPVELVDFSGNANKKSIELDWATASEQNSQVFEVQRSIDGNSFTEIGSLNGAGNSNIALNYRFTDHVPFNGLNYYRLRQMDFDGRFTFSKVIAVLFSQKLRRFEAVSNPVTGDHLRFMVESDNEALAEIQILDQQGRILKSEKILVNNGVNYTEILLQNQPAGNYMARLILGYEVRMMKFVKI